MQMGGRHETQHTTTHSITLLSHWFVSYPQKYHLQIVSVINLSLFYFIRPHSFVAQYTIESQVHAPFENPFQIHF